MLIQNKFISFEGIDGSGKTTQSKILADFLLDKKQSVLWTREPGGTDVAEQIREIVVKNKLSNLSELFLIMAARKEHIDHVINPALQNNHFVVCDRYIDSTVAYQASSTLTMNDILDLHRKYMEKLMPTMTFYIEVSYEVAMERIKPRHTNDRFDNLGQNFFRKLELHYKMLSEKFQDRIFTIDGNREIEELHHEVTKIVSEYYGI